ncbi:PREDICTED: forkhead box protein L2 [Chinchilla lanigera]|uniref:forkhead box protein L2 n=1 Tax=Chinchilla lanigera TaxID=34839 RepID=UPI000698A4F3|nr:PREDICTED: forkhead box protein L2 [Chinchilla lanigera]
METGPAPPAPDYGARETKQEREEEREAERACFCAAFPLPFLRSLAPAQRSLAAAPSGAAGNPVGFRARRGRGLPAVSCAGRPRPRCALSLALPDVRPGAAGSIASLPPKAPRPAPRARSARPQPRGANTEARAALASPRPRARAAPPSRPMRAAPPRRCP